MILGWARWTSADSFVKHYHKQLLSADAATFRRQQDFLLHSRGIQLNFSDQTTVFLETGLFPIMKDKPHHKTPLTARVVAMSPCQQKAKKLLQKSCKAKLKNPSVGDFPVSKNIEVSDLLSPVSTDGYSDGESVQIISDSSEDDVPLAQHQQKWRSQQPEVVALPDSPPSVPEQSHDPPPAPEESNNPVSTSLTPETFAQEPVPEAPLLDLPLEENLEAQLDDLSAQLMISLEGMDLLTGDPDPQPVHVYASHPLAKPPLDLPQSAPSVPSQS